MVTKVTSFLSGEKPAAEEGSKERAAEMLGCESVAGLDAREHKQLQQQQQH